jgi:hypothetical protein
MKAIASPALPLTLLALLAAEPAFARKPPPDADADEDTEKSEKAERDEKPSKIAASLEFMLGLGTKFESDVGGVKDQDGKAMLGIIPGFDRMLGRNFGIGGEYIFAWAGIDEKGAPSDRTLVMSPHLRARMTFPIWKGLTFDGLFGIGPTIWAGNETASKDSVEFGEMRDTRFGWSLRFNFGAGWKFNDSVAAFGALGYYTTTTYGDDVALNFNTVPFSVGLRSSF